VSTSESTNPSNFKELDIEEEFVNGDDYETIAGGNDDANDDVGDDVSNYNSGDNYNSIAAASHLRCQFHQQSMSSFCARRFMLILLVNCMEGTA